jgi:2-polyprenyl-3-methyl-5-hydroxy-6-metoxy-1,4-benzoquinol methylase
VGVSGTKEYWEGRLKNTYDLHGTGFIGLGRHYNSWMYKIRREVVLRKLKSLPIDFTKVSVLDIGSGVGFFIDIWKELGARVIGTDLTDVAVKNLKLKYPTDEFYTFDIGDDLNESLENRKFDIVSAFDVLFHIVDDNRYEKSIKNIHSVLRPHGLFIFSDNFLHGEVVKSTYQVSRQLSTIENILAQNEFEIIDRCPMFYLMSTPIDTTSPVAKLWWRFIKSILARYGDVAGLLVGGILYPLESILIRVMKESPTTEMMICRQHS